MSAVKESPFNKPNPFKYGNYERFKHPHIPSSHLSDFSSISNRDSFRGKQSRVSDSTWYFN